MHDPVFFDDLSVGDIFDSISKTITETEIIEFDGSMIRSHFHKYKPDALTSNFGFDSQWLYDGRNKFSSIMSVKWFPNDKFGSYGLDELRWLKPVKPDDTLRVSMGNKDLRRSKPRPESGIASCYLNN